VIGETTVIGERVTIYQGVTLGALNFPKDKGGEIVRGQKRHPTLGNDIVIYANATLLGARTTIGNNCVVGAGVTISKSIPANTLVVHEQAKLIHRARD